MLAVIGAIWAANGCRPSAPEAARRGPSEAARQLQERTDVLIENAAAALNDLPARVDTELAPPSPILTAASSSDGAEVRATFTTNPRTPDNPLHNYLRVSSGNANFRARGVRDGDLVRLFLSVAGEGPDMDLEQRTVLELTVRRLDDQDPENALLIESGLNAPVLEPQRIEIWRYSDKRMNEIRTRLARYATLREPAVGWEPTPDEGALDQITDRLNRWFRNQPPADSWKPSALVRDLPESLRNAEGLTELLGDAAQDSGEFAPWEGRYLQQAVWCRDISRWARGNAITDAEVAAALFDWTVRNVWLESADAPRRIFAPWQALVYGRGTALDRAWVFLELCRQQRIDACAVTLAAAADGAAARQLVGALADGKLLLFDAEYGLPLPSAAAGAVGSLSELRANPELLRRWDTGDGPAYPLAAADLAYAKAWLCASPWQVARRTAAVEDAMGGEYLVTLAARLDEQRDRLQAAAVVEATGLWTHPWDAFASQYAAKPSARMPAVELFQPFAQRPQLWKARVLHFQGDEQPRSDAAVDPLAEPRRSHQAAFALYQDKQVRPPQRLLDLLKQDDRAVLADAKRDAALWIGLLSIDRGSFENGRRWLEDLLLAPEPDGPRAAAARFALALCYERLQQPGRAAELLGDPRSPQRAGNLVRARLLPPSAE
jgi:hypothetical protein